MSDAALSLVVLVAAVVLFIWNRLPVAVVAVLVALALAATGVVDPATAISGFGDPVVIFIATLFVLSEGLESSGVTAWAGQTLLARVGSRRTTLLIALMCLTALLAALITPNGATAAMLPIMVLAARRAGSPTSQMAMPLAFAASAGALLVLSGSVVNVIVSDALAEARGTGFNFFEFGLIGAPLVIVTVLVAVLGGPRLLPRRTPSALPADLAGHLDTLVEHYRLDEGFFRLQVGPGSGLLGRTPESVEGPPDVRLVGVQSAGGQPKSGDLPLAADDVIVVTGSAEGVGRFADDSGLTITTTALTRETRTELLGREVGVAELVVPPRSTLVGESFFPGLVRSGVVVLAITHRGRRTGLQPVVLAEGDALFVHGSWPRIEALSQSHDVLVVDSPELLRRQAVTLGPKAGAAVGVLGLTVVLLAFGLVSPAIAGLVGATGMVLTGVVTVPNAFRAVSWELVVLIGGLIPLSVAIETSGAADIAADFIVNVVPPGNGHLLLVALFVVTAALGQVISNTATVLILTPVAVAAAAETGIALAPVLMLIAVAGAASFLTPIATAANMMVMGPGGYRFGEYWRLGIALMLAWLVVAVLLIPVLWPLTP